MRADMPMATGTVLMAERKGAGGGQAGTLQFPVSGSLRRPLLAGVRWGASLVCPICLAGAAKELDLTTYGATLRFQK